MKIRGESIDEALQQIDGAIQLLEKATKKVKEKKVKIAVAPAISTAEFPHIGPPPPTSCRDAIVRLLSTDWGRTPKTLGEITEAMKINGIYYPKSSVAAELLSITRSGIARRMKTKAGFAYILARPA